MYIYLIISEVRLLFDVLAVGRKRITTLALALASKVKASIKYFPSNPLLLISISIKSIELFTLNFFPLGHCKFDYSVSILLSWQFYLEITHSDSCDHHYMYFGLSLLKIGI